MYMNFLLKDYQVAMAVTFVVLLPRHRPGHAQILDLIVTACSLHIICTSYNNAPLNNKKILEAFVSEVIFGFEVLQKVYVTERASCTHPLSRRKQVRGLVKC